MSRAVSKAALRSVVVLALGAAAFTASVPAQQGATGSVQVSSPSCGGATSARIAPAARARRPDIAATRTRSTWRRSTAACGRRPTPGARGSRSSTISRPDRSAPSPSRRPTRTSSTSAAAKGCTGPTSRPATASTSRPTPGKTWTHLGLRDAQQIPNIAVDPTNPNRLFVAALGHPYGPNEERGIYRSTDGGNDLPEGALQGREHRRQRRRHRSVQPRHRLRHDVGRAAGAVGERGVGRHQRRHLQVDRRRHDVEAADQRAPRSSSRRTWRSRRRIRSGCYATVAGYDKPGTGQRSRRGGHLPQRRCRRDVDADHDRHASGRADRRRRPADADRRTRRIPTS